MKSDRKSGVAVIIVLGLLGLLMMMAVAFSVSMRVERRSAANYSNMVVSKYLVWAGLARALSEIDDEMGNAIYPPFDVLSPTNGASAADNIISSEVFDNIPRALSNLVTGIPVYWQEFNSEGANGYYSYVVLNCSDMLDINFVGGESRGAGTNVNELQISDLGAIVDWNDFEADRDFDVRYETLAELGTINSGIDPDDSENIFETFSRYPEGFLLHGGTASAVISDVPQVNLSGDESDLVAQQSAITDALLLAMDHGHGDMLTVGDSTFLFENLLDYVDSDSIPTNLASACTEAVPMINEIIVNGGMDGSGVGFDVRVEWFYPFVEGSSGSFDIELEMSYVWTNITQTTSVANALSPSDAVVNSGYSGQTTHYGSKTYGNGDFDESFSVNPGDTVKLTVDVKARVLLGGGTDTPVDSVPAPWTDTAMRIAKTFSGIVNEFDLSKEVVDPRFNWKVDEMWFDPSEESAASSINAQNYYTGLWLGDPSMSGGAVDKGTSMHVANRPLFSVGELGNLIRGTTVNLSGNYPYFSSIRLFKHVYGTIVRERDKVFDFFTLSTNSVRRGLVNINSLDPVVLDTAFTNMALAFPESGVINFQDAIDLRETILDWRDAGNEFYNVGDMAEIDWDAPCFIGRSDLEREAMLAYSYGLLGTRQNLFTIIVAATPARDQMGLVADQQNITQTLGMQRALVQVWRDPFPNADGNHDCFIRFFKWLSY